MNCCGTDYHGLDPKNRIFIPSAYRESLGENFFIYKGPENCVMLYDQERYNYIIDKFKDDSADPAARMKQRKFFINISPGKMDKQGRVTLGADILAHAGIDKEVVILGAGSRIELWSRENWDKLNEELSDGFYDGIVV